MYNNAVYNSKFEVTSCYDYTYTLELQLLSKTYMLQT